jgi:hypothetical protein
VSTHNGSVEIVPCKDDCGNHVFSVIVKRSYAIKPNSAAQRRDTDHPLLKIDRYYEDGDPDWSTVQYESEMAGYKPSADVVVIGKAYAPRGLPIEQMKAGIRVGDRQKILQITGDRQCHFKPDAAPVFSEPLPFKEMEIRYDRAYGGRDEKSVAEIPFFYPRNTMGKGVALRNVKQSIDGLALPNIEDPADLLTPERVVLNEPNRWHLQPIPQGFGWRQRTWYPRCALIGSYPPFLDAGTVTAEEQAGLLPKNHIALAKQNRLPPYETHFNNGASEGLVFSQLQGNEEITLGGLTPNGLLKFSLPGDAPHITLDLGYGANVLAARLQTVSIRPDDLEVDLIWRGALAYEGYAWLPKMKRLHAEVH